MCSTRLMVQILIVPVLRGRMMQNKTYMGPTLDK